MVARDTGGYGDKDIGIGIGIGIGTVGDTYWYKGRKGRLRRGYKRAPLVPLAPLAPLWADISSAHVRRLPRILFGDISSDSNSA